MPHGRSHLLIRRCSAPGGRCEIQVRGQGMVARHLNFADVKLVAIANVVDENIQLRAKVKALENAGGAPCPKCRKRGWTLEHSKPDPVLA